MSINQLNYSLITYFISRKQSFAIKLTLMNQQDHRFACDLQPLILTWINFNPDIDSDMPSNVRDEIIYPFLNFNYATVEV